jgi:hypothetical protein
MKEAAAAAARCSHENTSILRDRMVAFPLPVSTMQRRLHLHLPRTAAAVCSALLPARVCTFPAKPAKDLMRVCRPQASVRWILSPSEQRGVCQCRALAHHSSSSLRAFASSSSGSGNDSQASSSSSSSSSSSIIFQPALTVPRFLRAFAISQAAVCLVSGGMLVVLRNPLTGGTLKLASVSLALCLIGTLHVARWLTPLAPCRDTMLGVGVVLFGAITLRAISAYVTCHISRIDTVDHDALLVKSLAMPFGEKEQIVTRHAFHAMGSSAAPHLLTA